MELHVTADEGPSGWFITHNLAYGYPHHFGPFATREEAEGWASEHPDVVGFIRPLFLTVDWERP